VPEGAGVPDEREDLRAVVSNRVLVWLLLEHEDHERNDQTDESIRRDE
jgi:hypothetical protein